MATKEKNTKKKKTVLKIGLIILGIGLLAFGGTLLLGLITLARDLMYTAIALDTLLVGGVLGKKAYDGIVSKISDKKSKNLTREKERTLNNNRDNDIIVEEEKKDIEKVVENALNGDSKIDVKEEHMEDGSIEFSFGADSTKESKQKTVNTPRKR